jgi:hypothetical protein
MKMLKKLPLLLLVAAPLVLPVPTRAGDDNDQGQNQGQNKDKNHDQDKDHDKDKDKDKNHDQDKSQDQTWGQNPQNDPTRPGTSVPLNKGLVFLSLAGLGLGAWVIYGAKVKKEEA